MSFFQKITIWVLTFCMIGLLCIPVMAEEVTIDEWNLISHEEDNEWTLIDNRNNNQRDYNMIVIQLCNTDIKNQVMDYAQQQQGVVHIDENNQLVFPTLTNGTVVSDDLYAKYSNGAYCAKVFAYKAFQRGWRYSAVVGALAFMYGEGMGINGTFSYEGCWTVTGPTGVVYDRTLNNDAWRTWINSESCASQMVATTSWYSPAHYATGLGFCAESSVWDNGRKTLDLCDRFLDAADYYGVAWQDINFQSERAFEFLCSTAAQSDPDWRDPTQFTGTPEEYCNRMFCTIGYTAFNYGDDNGQLQSHLDLIPTVTVYVNDVVNGTWEA